MNCQHGKNAGEVQPSKYGSRKAMHWGQGGVVKVQVAKV
jgi:hypothetical protein